MTQETFVDGDVLSQHVKAINARIAAMDPRDDRIPGLLRQRTQSETRYSSLTPRELVAARTDAWALLSDDDKRSLSLWLAHRLSAALDELDWLKSTKPGPQHTSETNGNPDDAMTAYLEAQAEGFER